jgi:anti-sigma factor NepR-like protein
MRCGLTNAREPAIGAGGGNKMTDRKQDKRENPEFPTRKNDSPMHSQITPRKRPARLGPEIQSRIGQQLRAMYDDVVKQGVPDRFADLLRKLDEADKGSR